MITVEDLVTELERQKILLHKANLTLRKHKYYAAMSLKGVMVKSTMRFYITRIVDGIRVEKYVSKENLYKVEAIRTVRFCRELKRRTEGNIKELERFMRKFRAVDFGSIRIGLAPVYRDIPDEIKLLYYSDEGKKWVEKMTAFRNSMPRVHPENLTEITNSGEYVRSKSEAAIYNLLMELNLPFVYELPLMLTPERILHPDFTVYVGNGMVIYIEHDGAFYNNRKRENTLLKFQTYYEYGMMPNMDILFTFNDRNGHINTAHIKAQILAVIEWKRQYGVR